MIQAVELVAGPVVTEHRLQTRAGHSRRPRSAGGGQ